MTPYESLNSFLTVMSLIIIFWTLFELKNQRESMYKPALIVKSNGIFFMYSEKNLSTFLPSLWTMEEIDTDRNKHHSHHNPHISQGTQFIPDISIPGVDKHDPPEKQWFINAKNNPDRNKIKIPLFNIGMGAAKQIKINWEYERKGIIKLFEDYKRSQRKDKLSPFSVRAPFKCSSGLNMEELIDYVPPSKIGSEEIVQNIFFPYEFQHYFNVYVACLDIEELKILPLILHNTPELFLNIQYNDLTDNTQHKKFRINFKIDKKHNRPPLSGIDYIDNVKVEFNITEYKNEISFHPVRKIFISIKDRTYYFLFNNYPNKLPIFVNIYQKVKKSIQWCINKLFM